jgi:hypothetical protein
MAARGTILVLSTEDDEHVDGVAGWLAERGRTVVRFDPALLPNAAELVSEMGDTTGHRRLLR